MLLTSRQKEVVKPQLWKVWHYLFLLCSWKERAIAVGLWKTLPRWTSDHGKVSVSRKHPWVLPGLRAHLLPKVVSSRPLPGWTELLLDVDAQRVSETVCCRDGRRGETEVPSCYAHMGIGSMMRNKSHPGFHLRSSGKRLKKKKSQRSRIGLSKHQPWTWSQWLTS